MLRDIKYTSVKIWENTKVIYVCHKIKHIIVIIYLIICYDITFSYKNIVAKVLLRGDNWKYTYIKVTSIVIKHRLW